MADGLTVLAQLVDASGVALVIDNETDPTVPYSLIRKGVGPGSYASRKITVQSPFVDGRFITHVVKDIITMDFSIRVRGSSVDWVDFYIGQILTVVENHFQLRLNINGTVHAWDCEACDSWSVGSDGDTTGQWDDLGLRSFTQTVNVTTVRNPAAAVGRF